MLPLFCKDIYQSTISFLTIDELGTVRSVCRTFYHYAYQCPLISNYRLLGKIPTLRRKPDRHPYCIASFKNFFWITGVNWTKHYLFDAKDLTYVIVSTAFYDTYKELTILSFNSQFWLVEQKDNNLSKSTFYLYSLTSFQPFLQLPNLLETQPYPFIFEINDYFILFGYSSPEEIRFVKFDLQGRFQDSWIITSHTAELTEHMIVTDQYLLFSLLNDEIWFFQLETKRLIWKQKFPDFYTFWLLGSDYLMVLYPKKWMLYSLFTGTLIRKKPLSLHHHICTNQLGILSCSDDKAQFHPTFSQSDYSHSTFQINLRSEKACCQIIPVKGTSKRRRKRKNY